MKKLLYSTAVIIAMFCTACDHYDHAIADQGDRLDILEKSTIKNIDNQVDAINTSITDLKNVDAELEGLIETLKTADAENAALISELQAKDTVLNEKIADLEKYVTDEISATEDWANATFATLTQYTDLQTELSGLTALVGQQGNELASVKTAVEALDASITTLEASMKQWVNETLAAGYYDIAAIDAKLSVLEKAISDADEALAQKIEDQQTALEDAKTALTTAYQKAIAEAIETNNGKISADIASAVKTATDDLNTKLDAVNDSISSIEKDIELLKSAVATIQEQIGAINTSITNLKNVDAELEGLIETLKTADTENAALIAELQAKDTVLNEKIADLEKYVTDEISATEDWANTTFATLTQYTDLQTELSGLSALVGQQGNELASVKTAVEALDASITTLEASMKQWVNETLAVGYYDIAAIDTKLSVLEKAVSDADEALAQKIEDQQTALEDAKTALTTAYQKAIAEAIETNNGKISADIASAVKTATDDLNAELLTIESNITAINDKLDALLDAFTGRIQSIRFLPEYSDGKVEFLSEINLDFMLAPKAIAGEIKNEHVTAFISRTKTRAADTPIALTVTSVTGDATTGTLKVVVNTENLPQGFWRESGNANIFICISDGNNDLISELIPIVTVQILDSEEEFRAALAEGYAKLEDNIVLTSPVTIQADHTTTIDLNGHELSYTSSTQNESMILNNGTLTIKDETAAKSGSVTYNYAGAADNTYGKGNYAINNSGNLTVEANINAVAGEVGKKFTHAFYAIHTSGSTTINSGKILNNTNIAIRQWVGSEEKSSDIIVNGGEIEGLRAIWIQLPSSDKTKAPKSNLIVKKGVLRGTAIDGNQDSGNVLAIYATSQGNQMKNVNINIEDGDFYGDLQLTGGRKGAKVDVEKVTITGGTFHAHNGQDIYSVCSWADDELAAETITITGGTFAHLYPLRYMDGDNGKIDIKLAADVTESYASVVVPSGNEVTLDLNGKTISQTSDVPVSMITNNGNMTIKDSSNGSGKIDFTFNGTVNNNVAANAISNRGTLVVEGGEISNTTTSGSTQIGYAIDNYNGATLTVDGGKISATGGFSYDGIRLFCGSNETTVTVNEGEISTIWAQNPTKDKATAVNGNVIINGGEVTTIYYENFTTVKVKTGVNVTVTPFGVGNDNTQQINENDYTVYSFVH